MGLLGDLVGNAAIAGKDILDRDIAAESQLTNQKALADYQSQLQAQREETVEKLKVKLQEDLRQQQQQRMTTQMGQVQEGAKVVAEERKGKRLAQTQEVAPSMDAATFDKVSKTLGRAGMQKYYGVAPDSATSEIDDQIVAGNRAGAYDAVAALQAQRKDVVAQMKMDQDRDIAAAKDDTTNNRIAAMLTGQQTTLQGVLARVAGNKDVAEIRAESGGKGGGGNLTESERKKYTALMSDTTRQILSKQTALKSVYNEEDKKALRDDITNLQTLHNEYSSKLANSQPAAGASKTEGDKTDSKPVKELTYDPKTRTFK